MKTIKLKNNLGYHYDGCLLRDKSFQTIEEFLKYVLKNLKSLRESKYIEIRWE